MFSTPTRPSVKDFFSTPATNRRPNIGLFENGQWKCDCSPREVAPLRTVHKNGPNQGRQFYNCPKGPGNQSCTFFLWADSPEVTNRSGGGAAPRNQPQLPTPSLSRPKPQGTQVTIYSTAKRRRDSEAEDRPGRSIPFEMPRKEPRSSVAQTSPSKLSDFEIVDLDDDECDFDAEYDEFVKVDKNGGVKSGEVKGFVPLTPRKDGAEKKGRINLSSVSKARKKLFAPKDTPAAPQDGNGMEPRQLPPSTPELPTGTQEMDMMELPATPVSPAALRNDGPSPPVTPAQPLPGVATPALGRSASQFRSLSLVEEVMGLVEYDLDEYVKQDLERILEKHERKTLGIIQGREISRTALRQRDTEILELMERILELEKELLTEREINSTLKGAGQGMG